MAASDQCNNGSYPLKDISAPHAHDVLCGRGGGTNNHIGNSHWRMLVAANKQLYITLPKRQKMLLSRSIVNAVRGQNPPGRFLQKDSKTNKWFDVGDHRAQEKTSQALREGAPDIRKKVGGKTDVESTEKSTASSDDEQTASAASDAKPTSTAQSPSAPSSVAPIGQDTQAPSCFPLPVESQTNKHSTPPHYGTMPGGHHPMGMHPGGMPQFFIPSMGQVGQQGMVLYAGPNMQPVQVFPTMVMNEHGMMVPGMSMMPAIHTPMLSMPMSYSPYRMSEAGSAATPPASNTTHKGDNDERGDDAKKTPTFDEFVACPPDNRDGYGSATMPTAEMTKAQAGGTSFGSVMSYKYAHNTEQGGLRNVFDEDATALAMDSLEPIGISFGDVSMMSTGTNRLEVTGTSFGTMMSLSTMPDGGLEVVGTSFGSLSLDPMDRDQLFQRLEITGGGPKIPPIFDSEDKATGNLLECSDTESEDSESNPDLVAQKSEAWEKMQMSVAQTKLRQSQSKGTVNSNELMPPPVSGRENGQTRMNGTILSVIPTNLQRDFSQLSAWDDDADDDNHAASPPPPPQLEKQESDDDEVLLGYLSNRQR